MPSKFSIREHVLIAFYWHDAWFGYLKLIKIMIAFNILINEWILLKVIIIMGSVENKVHYYACVDLSSKHKNDGSKFISKIILKASWLAINFIMYLDLIADINQIILQTIDRYFFIVSWTLWKFTSFDYIVSYCFRYKYTF